MNESGMASIYDVMFQKFKTQGFYFQQLYSMVWFNGEKKVLDGPHNLPHSDQPHLRNKTGLVSNVWKNSRAVITEDS